MHLLRRLITAAITTALGAVTLINCSAAGTGWGLSHPVPGAAPKGMATREELLEYDTYYVGCENEKNVYLTFDAGYENGYTEKILDVLKKTQTTAAFFLVGTYIQKNPELVKRMVAEGHIVANHTHSHPDMSAISSLDAFKKELEQVEQAYKEVTDQDMPKYYRPPRGVYSTENLKMAKELGYKTVFWSLAYVDWNKDKQPSRDEAFSKLIPRAHPGMVPLLHSTSSTNAEILEELIAKYKEMGYMFKSLDELTAC